MGEFEKVKQTRDVFFRGATVDKLYKLLSLSTVAPRKKTSRVCLTFSNSPNPSRVYIRLCKHGKRFLLLK